MPRSPGGMTASASSSYSGSRSASRRATSSALRASGRSLWAIRRQASSASTCSQTTRWRSSASRTRSERTLPPPSAIAPPSASSSSRPTSSASRARNASSPSRANASAIGIPSSRSISSSTSVVSSPASRAAASAAVLPAPMKPMKTSAGRLHAHPPVDALLVSLDRGEHVVDVVAAELLPVAARQGEADHRLGDDRRRRDHRGVGALAQRLRRLLGLGVDRAQRLGQGRDRLDRGAHRERLAVGHPALEAAGVVGLAEVAALLRPEDLVVGLRAGPAGDVPGLADRDALDRLDRGDGAGEAAVEAVFPGDVGAEPGDEAEGAHLEAAAEALVGLAQAVDLLDHRGARLGVEAAHRVVVDRGEVLRAEVGALRRPHRGDLGHVAVDADAKRGEEAAGQRAGRDAGGGLAGAGPLEHVADVGVAVLLGADQVGVAGPRQVDLVDLRVDRPGVHPLLPVGVVAVGDEDRDRAAEGAAVAQAGADLDRVGLDLHPPAAPVAELAAGHVAVERLAVEGEAGGHALDDRDQPGAVRLACRGEAERAHAAPRL